MANQHDSAGTYETNVPAHNQSGNSQSTQSEDDEDEQTAELEQTYHTPQPSRRPGNEEDRGGGPSRRRGQSVDSGGLAYLGLRQSNLQYHSRNLTESVLRSIGLALIRNSMLAHLRLVTT
uniref:Uncharacterized protein n=1 Tax=Bionectria ochroleuca TaxID=29856 RepID=A0A8H7TRN4_BIOOC